MRQRSSMDSPMPMIPPVQTVIPASANGAKREQAIVVGARRDDRAVVLARSIDVVVVGVEPRFFETPGLVGGQHPEVQAGFRGPRLHAAHHIENTIEGGPVFYLAPRGAHAESRAPAARARVAASEDVVEREHLLAGDGRLVVARLRTVGAVSGQPPVLTLRSVQS